MRITLLVLAAATLAACTRSADLPSALVANDSEAVFDTVVDAPLSRRTFTFTNVGPSQTRPLQVELHGDRDLFAVDWEACSGVTLEQDGRCDVVVRLDGNAAGAFDGELRVFADATLSASVLLHGKVAPTFAGWSGTSPCSGTGGCAGFVGADNRNVMVVATFSK